MWRNAVRILGCSWLVCAAFLANASQVLPVALSGEEARVPVWQSLRVSVPDDPYVSPAQAAVLSESPLARTVDSPQRILGRGSKPHWALFALTHDGRSDLQRFLMLEATTQHHLDLFMQTDTGAWHAIGSVAEAAGKSLAGGTMHPAWEINLRAQRPTRFLLRVAGPSLVRFPVYVMSPTAFASAESKLHIGVGLAIGTCLLVLAYIWSLLSNLHDRAAPLLMIMIVTDLAGALWLSGYLGALLPWWSESARSLIGLGAYSMLFGTGILHARIHLECELWTPRWDQFLGAFGAIWIGLGPWMPLLLPAASRIVVLWGGTLVALLLIGIALRALLRGRAHPGYIALAWIVYLLAGTSFLLPRIFDSPALWMSSLVALMMSAMVAGIFGFSLAVRMRARAQHLASVYQQAVIQETTTAALMRERSLYFAATSHDLRQPLVGIGLYADLLKAATTLEDRQKHAGRLESALDEVDSFLFDMQQLVAESQAATHPASEQIGLDALLEPIIEEYRLLAVTLDKRLSIRYVPTRLVIRANAHYFRRICRNALSNAIHYTDAGGRILVGCRRASPSRLVIIDTGRGMTDEQIRLAFNSFQRFDRRMLNPDGFGLGLFSTHSLAGAIGLTVTLRSQLGRGTEFRIQLPLGEARKG